MVIRLSPAVHFEGELADNPICYACGVDEESFAVVANIGPSYFLIMPS